MMGIEIVYRTWGIPLRDAARRFVSDRSGTAAMEYIVTGAIIAVGVAAGVSVLSGAITDLYQIIIDALG